nr:retrovirus-related Pol polyprotein from transposon TNT 1-94 [Tanacetum cinerariifolium]
AEATNTACYTQNRSLIRLCYNKIPYELMYDKKPNLSYLYVFGSLCYPTNDSENLGKLKAEADICIFVGYAPSKKAFRIYNKRTRLIMKTIHVTFDELTTMESEQFSSGPDAPFARTLSIQEQEHSPIISQGVEESPKTPYFHDDPLHEGSSSNVRPSHTPFKLLGTLVVTLRFLRMDQIMSLDSADTIAGKSSRDYLFLGGATIFTAVRAAKGFSSKRSDTFLTGDGYQTRIQQTQGPT